MKNQLSLDGVRIAVRDAARDLRLSPVIVALAVGSLALALVGVGLGRYMAARTAVLGDRASADLTAWISLPLEASKAEAKDLVDQAAASPLTATVDFRGPEQERTRLVALLDAGLLEGVDERAIPAQPVIEVRFIPGDLDAERLAEMTTLLEAIRTRGPTEDIAWSPEHVGAFLALDGAVSTASWLLGLLALVSGGAFMALFVRLRLRRRSREIKLLRAFGATEGHVYAPTWVTGVAVGLGGGLIALVVALVVDGKLSVIAERAPELGMDLGFVGVGMIAWCLLGGLVVALTGTAFAVWRHQR